MQKDNEKARQPAGLLVSAHTSLLRKLRVFRIHVFIRNGLVLSPLRHLHSNLVDLLLVCLIQSRRICLFLNRLMRRACACLRLVHTSSHWLTSCMPTDDTQPRRGCSRTGFTLHHDTSQTIPMSCAAGHFYPLIALSRRPGSARQKCLEMTLAFALEDVPSMEVYWMPSSASCFGLGSSTAIKLWQVEQSLVMLFPPFAS